MILRVIGSLLVVSGSVGLGCWYRRQISFRIRNLEELVRMLDLMMSEIRYSKATLPECCRSLEKQLWEPYAEGFHRIVICLEAEDSICFAEAFSKSMQDCLKQTAAGQEETGIMLRFARSSSAKDAAMQLLGMERCLQNLLAVKEKLESEASEKGRMAVGLGSLGGLLLLVLLL